MTLKTGALIFDETADRYDIRFDVNDYYGGLHCGDCMEVFVRGKWKPTRIIYLHLKDTTTLDYYDKIENLERKLDNRFFKCHRSYLINLQYLKSYKTGQAYLVNGETIPVSRLRGEEFSQIVLQYMKERRDKK